MSGIPEGVTISELRSVFEEYGGVRKERTQNFISIYSRSSKFEHSPRSIRHTLVYTIRQLFFLSYLPSEFENELSARATVAKSAELVGDNISGIMNDLVLKTPEKKGIPFSPYKVLLTTRDGGR